MSDNIKDGKVYGCHVDLGPGDRPDDCVIDYDAHSDCVYAKTTTGRRRRSKWGCKYWKPFKNAEDGE